MHVLHRMPMAANQRVKQDLDVATLLLLGSEIGKSEIGEHFQTGKK